MKCGKIPGLETPADGKFGNDTYKGRTVAWPIPEKPGGQGPSGTHGSYKKGSAPGTVKNK